MKRFRSLCALALSGLAVLACENTPAGVSNLVRPSFLVVPAPELERVSVCKAYTGSVVADSFSFTGVNTNTSGSPFKVGSESCRRVSLNGGANVTTSVTEVNIPAGIQLDSIVVHQLINGTTTQTKLTGTNTGSAVAGGSPTAGGVIVFYNSVIPVVGGEGCTPGYWKQEQHFDSWTTYTQNQSLESVFDVPDSFGLDNVTLVAALSLEGGSGTLGAARILLRAAVAALLNSTSGGVDYSLTTAQVIAQVNAALASGSRSTMLTLATTLDNNNNLGCTLN